jgi:hypothetical protein
MLSNEEKVNLLKIEGRRLVQAYEAEHVRDAMFGICPVCEEAKRLMIDSDIESRCGICHQLGVGKRCKRFIYLSDGFIGLALLFNSQALRNEEIMVRKRIKEIILEVKDELDKLLDKETD